MGNDLNKKVDKIQYFGIDGLLILAWFVVVGLILVAFSVQIDFLIQWVFPAVLFITTTLIFLDYCTRVGGFIKASRANADLRKDVINQIENMESKDEE